MLGAKVYRYPFMVGFTALKTACCVIWVFAFPQRRKLSNLKFSEAGNTAPQQPLQQQPQQQQDPKKAVEDVIKDLFRKGLQDVFKKQ